MGCGHSACIDLCLNIDRIVTILGNGVCKSAGKLHPWCSKRHFRKQKSLRAPARIGVFNSAGVGGYEARPAKMARSLGHGNFSAG